MTLTKLPLVLGMSIIAVIDVDSSQRPSIVLRESTDTSSVASTEKGFTHGIIDSLGKVRITSTPPGATIIINNVPKGESPLEVELEVGYHSIVAQLEGYSEYHSTIQVVPGIITPLEIIMKKPGILVIHSPIQQAEVYIEGQQYGMLPFRQVLRAGEYRVRVSKIGYEEWERLVQVEEGKELVLEVNLVSLSERTAPITMTSININTNPPKSDIYLDDLYVGQAPITIDKEEGFYKVQIKHQGFLEYTSLIQIKKGEHSHFFFSLTKPSTLIIRSPIHGAEIYIEDQFSGTTPADFKLRPGVYTLKVSKVGYNDWTGEIHLEEGKTYTQDVRLQDAFTRQISDGASDAPTYWPYYLLGVTTITGAMWAIFKNERNRDDGNNGNQTNQEQFLPTPPSRPNR